MKKILTVLLIVMMLCATTWANNIKEVDVLSCNTDLSIGKYDGETKFILEIREDANTYTNVYTKQQIQRSNKEYSYIIDRSNCIYLNEVDYKLVKDDKNATTWVWVIILGLMCFGLTCISGKRYW